MIDELPEFSTKPEPGDVVKDDGPHAVLVRLHTSDWNILKLMLKRDELSFQRFVGFLAKAYLDGDPDLVKCLRRYRTLELIPEKESKNAVFSSRERAEIYAELEKEQKGQNDG